MLWCFAARPSLDFGYDNSWLVQSAFDYGVYINFNCQETYLLKLLQAAKIQSML